MVGNKVLNRFAVYVTLVVLGVLLSILLLTRGATTAAAPLTDVAAESLEVSAAPQFQAPEAASAAETWTTCTPVSVASYSNRIHVKCSASVGGIWYFAASTSNPANTARLLSLLSTARVAGHTLGILYDPADTSGTSIGCQANDCRLILAVALD